MPKSSPIKIAFLDVGHGDSIVLSMTDKKGLNRAIIVDSGNYIKTKKYIKENDIDIVDHILITHFHTDHYRGINSLIDSLTNSGILIKNICWEKDKVYREPEDEKTYVAFTTKLLDNHLKLGIDNGVKRFSNTDYIKLSIDDVDELDIKIVYPNNFAANKFSDKNVNNTSTVLKIEYRNKKIILPGDLEGEGWKILNTYLKDLRCDILKMPHHGDYFNSMEGVLSTKEIIDNTTPRFAVISTGKNDKYNHPDKNTIDCLRDEGVTVLCTQVTDICDDNRMDKRECAITKLDISRKGYNKNWCPCIGDIVFEIDEDIKLIPHTLDNILDIKKTFEAPKCINE
ncbi:hypothetical protein UT300018_31290 [Clostridium faecium]|uniref:MBL fold metallo-hydrolase n=1 Tax=Clostridium faecium TaxID=2762223 RepID=A0ABR8YNE8_9CLOT|nr:MBL fold metallo-hydrolase [Clostridium faecium]MBD8045740.1 MBL fold metallo-hydrolase [Clostridium faecium]